MAFLPNPAHNTVASGQGDVSPNLPGRQPWHGPSAVRCRGTPCSQVVSMEQTQLSPAFTDGYDSGRDGGPRTDNPHKADSAEAEQWLEGWNEGLAKRDAVTPNRNAIAQGTSETLESEPIEPGERGEIAAAQGEPVTANPYPEESAEAEEWLDGHDYVTSRDAEETLPRPDLPPLGPELTSSEDEPPSYGVTIPSAGED